MSKNIIYSPREIGQAGYDAAHKAASAKNLGIELDVPGTDIKDYFAPLLPWEICAIQGQTSNGKSYFKDWWLKRIVKQFKKSGRNQIIIDVHLEETIEAVAFAEYGRRLGVRPADLARGEYTNFDKMLGIMTEMDGIPIWHIGVSAKDDENTPQLTLSNIYKAIKALKSGEITGSEWDIGVVSVDYLQALPIDNEIKKAKHDAQRRLQVTSDVNRLRAMTAHLECPIIIPLQAKQKLEGNSEPYFIPGTYDGSETMSIATRFDRILSIWMPSQTHPELMGEKIYSKDGRSVDVKENNAWLKVNKQRGGLPSGKSWQMKIDFKNHEYESIYGGMNETI
jgi:hypothetical protein